MDESTLLATDRSVLGKKTRFLRRQGITPVHLFGHGLKSQALQCDTAKLRQILADNALLRRKIESMERKYDEQFQQVFAVLKCMITEETKPKQSFGFRSKKLTK